MYVYTSLDDCETFIYSCQSEASAGQGAGNRAENAVGKLKFTLWRLLIRGRLGDHPDHAAAVASTT